MSARFSTSVMGLSLTPSLQKKPPGAITGNNCELILSHLLDVIHEAQAISALLAVINFINKEGENSGNEKMKDA